MNTQDLINYYASLLILQYSALPNAQKTIQLVVGEMIQNQIIQQVDDGFDVDTAIGNQLNILGSYRGITRQAFGLTPGNYWSLPSVNDALPGGFLGWASVSDANPPTTKWLQINDTENLTYALTDNQMRRLIKLKAELDSWDGSLGGLDAILFAAFGAYVYPVDAGNMSMVYHHVATDPDPDSLWAVAVLEGVFPHPAGIATSFVEV